VLSISGFKIGPARLPETVNFGAGTLGHKNMECNRLAIASHVIITSHALGDKSPIFGGTIPLSEWQLLFSVQNRGIKWCLRLFWGMDR